MNGYSDSFNSDRYIYKDYGNGRQLVYHDRVTANARSEAFAKEHDGFTEPDGVYGYTFEGGSLVKQADGTYNSNKFKNVIRHTTNDPNIPEDIREKINNGDFYDHANQFKIKTNLTIVVKIPVLQVVLSEVEVKHIMMNIWRF